MNFLLWITNVIDIYDFCCKASEKLSRGHSARQKLDNIDHKLVQIQQALAPYLPQQQEKQTFHPYTSTIFDAKLLYKDTVVKKIKESIIEPTLAKTVIMEQQNNIVGICKETIGALKSVLASMPPLDSNEMANIAGILEMEPQLSEVFSSAEIPFTERETVENVEFTISEPAPSVSKFTFVSNNIPQRKGVAQCVNCGYQVKENDVEHKKVILRKNSHYCMSCICDKGAGDFPTIGKYRILHKLGEGGMADVFFAVHTTLRTPMAFKWLRKMDDPSPDTIRRFKLDCQISANLDHLGIVKVFDAGTEVFHESKQVYYIVMEVIKGKTLEEYQKQYGNFSVVETVAIAKQMCDILNYAYSMGVVHRDLKPGNIFLLEDNTTIKLCDFGLAKFFDEYNLSGTKSGVAMGTPGYMPPEQFFDARQTDQRSDIYSLGATLYTLLTGQNAIPINGCEMSIYARRISSELPTLPSHYNKGIPQLLDNIILKCLEIKRSNRYQQPLDILHDLNKITL